MTALLGVLAGGLSLVAAPAVAAPIDQPWTPSGVGSTPISNGTQTAASFSYSLNPAGFSVRSWDFTAVAAAPVTSGDPVRVPYTWQGLHAWFQVTTRLDLIVDGVVVDTLEQHGAANCCTTPSNGFLYGGVATFDNVPAGKTYGFRLSGSNVDSNNFLQGTFTLSTKPYLDALIGQDNRDWPGAKDLETAAAGSRSINESGEARWFKFPVVPGQDIKVTLGNLAKDYDLALYGDIQAAYDELSGDGSAQTGTSGGTGVADAQVPEYPVEVATIPTANNPDGGKQFAPRIYAPRIYAPRIYAPRIYAPRIYAPRIYAPRIYAPRIYAPDSYIPEVVSDPSFQQAFSAAQNQTLLAVSTNPGNSAEEVTASSGNTNGFFYVRVQGHGAEDFSANAPFTLSVTAGGSGCEILESKEGLELMPPVDPDAPAEPATVIVTDSVRTNYALDENGDRVGSPEAFLDDLELLADDTGGVVLDVAQSPRVQALWEQASTQNDCPYAVNLVASAIDEIIGELRNPASRYVVLAGGDDVVPFFRYPDVSGLGPESQFSPPMREGTASFGSLSRDQVLSQDAYGSDTEVTIAGSTLPVPDLAVGRLVKTDQEIGSQIDNFLALDGGTLPTPTSSLVTGYDFLTDAANAVNSEFQGALGQAGTSDTLISDNSDPDDVPWNADALEEKLLGGPEHDLVFLAGHFSANDTLAADFATSLNARELAPDGPYPGHLKNTLVLSAGCHSGYNIVDKDAVPDETETNDWTQRMAQQGALLIGGTGYQYGDTDFLEYSERLYLELARRLHELPANGSTDPIAVGRALVLAKQDYLAGLTAVSGIDQKALLQATLYGLPMTGFDAPGREALDVADGQVAPGAVTDREPGATLGLRFADKTYDTTSTPRSKTVSYDPDPTDEIDGTDIELSWLDGDDGVVSQPGLPALPKQIENVGVDGAVLRGVGFRGGAYHDSPTGVYPLTGAPAIEGSTPNSTFESDIWFPQSLTSANYFGTVGTSGRTSLILTPAQYRTEAGTDPDLPANTQRAYDDMGVRLFYTGPDSAGDAALAAPPSITDVRGTYVGDRVTISAQVTGDPSAGVQQVWVTWTGGVDAQGEGVWAPVDLAQDPNASSRWSGTFDLAGTPAADVRFLVQAVSGAGAVALDTAEGNGYGLADASALPATVSLETHEPTEVPASPVGVTARVLDTNQAPVAGRLVRFTVSRGGGVLYRLIATTGPDGTAELGIPSNRAHAPVGDLHVVGELLSASGTAESTDEADVHAADTPVSISPTSPAFLAARVGTAYPVGSPLTATVRDDYGTVPDYPVRFAFPLATSTATARFVGPNDTRLDHVDLFTGDNGTVSAGPAVALSVPGSFWATITAGNATAQIPMAAQYAIGAFVSPVGSTTTTSATGTTPIKVSAMGITNVPLSDAAAAALVTNRQIQVRWRKIAPGTPVTTWTTLPNLPISYDAKKDFFQVDMKASAVGWVKPNTYRVEFRVLAAGSVATRDVNDPFDLGSRSFDVTVTK